MVAVVRWLVYTNIWVSLVAPSMLWFAASMLNENVGVERYVFVLSATLFTYNIQRLYKAKEYLSPNTLNRHKWIWEHRKELNVITWLAGLSTLICLFFVSYLYLLWLIPAVLVSALYFIPFFGSPSKPKRLRDVAFLKIALVAFVWTWISVVCLALMVDKPLNEWVGLATFQFLFCFALTIPFDIRDAQFDKKEGTRTFVSQWGIVGAKILSSICFALSIACLFFIPIRWELILCLCLYIVWASLSTWFASSQRHELYYGFFLDGFFLFQGPMVYVVISFLGN